MLATEEPAVPVAPPAPTEEEMLQATQQQETKPVVTKKKLYDREKLTFSDELLKFTKNRKDIGALVSSTHQVFTYFREEKSNVKVEDEKKPECIVTLHTQTMLANSAASKANVVAQNIQEKITHYQTALEQLNADIAKLNKSMLEPFSYAKLLLQLKINRILVSSHLRTIGHQDTFTPRAEQCDEHQARSINRALCFVMTQDTHEIKSLAEKLAEKLINSALVNKKEIANHDQANKAVEKCYEKIIRQTLMNNRYTLPKKTKEEDYLFSLSEKLCETIVKPAKNLFSNAADTWVMIDKPQEETTYSLCVIC